MSGAEPLLIASVIGSAGTTAYGTMKSAEALGASKEAQLMAAQEQSEASLFEKRQQEIQAKRYRSAAAADEAVRRDSLQSSLDTIDVFRAGRGLSLDSPTGRAIQAGVSDRAERDIITSRTNLLAEAANRDLAAELAGRKSRYSLMAGDAAARATDAQIGATYAAGIGKIAGIGLDLAKPARVRA